MNPVEQLLGKHFQPVPTTWSWMKANTAGQGTTHLLVFETPMGRNALVFTEEDLAVFIRTAQEALTGLTLPVTGLVTP